MEKTRVFIGLLGTDQHELGAVAVSRILRDAGFEVVYGGRFNIPEGIVKTRASSRPLWKRTWTSSASRVTPGNTCTMRPDSWNSSKSET